MELGVFIPIGNNGWLISTTSPQYKPSFDLNCEVVQKAERFGFDFALSMIKTARVRRAIAILGLQPGIVHADGRTSGSDELHPPVRHLRGADHTAADRCAHGGHDRLDFTPAVGHQHHFRLATPRIYANGDLAGRGALPPPLRLLRRVGDHHARIVGDRPIQPEGRFLPDG